jgi:hypothetical protein
VDKNATPALAARVLDDHAIIRLHDKEIMLAAQDLWDFVAQCLAVQAQLPVLDCYSIS